MLRYISMNLKSFSRRLITINLLLAVCMTVLCFPLLQESPAQHGITNYDDNINADSLYLTEFVLASDVVEREPVEIVQSYSMSDGRAWCFARLNNNAAMQDVYFRWYYEDELYFEMNSKIGVSPNWRTYSSVGLQPGSWRVILENKEGDLLGEITFRVSE